MTMMNVALEKTTFDSLVAQESPRFPRASVATLQCHKSELSERECPVICESTFTVVVNGKPLSHLQCSNNALAELAYGFLYNEGLIAGVEDVESFSLDPVNLVATFELNHSLVEEPTPVRSSGFGGFALA